VRNTLTEVLTVDHTDHASGSADDGPDGKDAL
jgi:hypothetical protein